MTEKRPYEYIKNYISLFNYELLSKEYKGNKFKLEIKCNKGHIFKSNFNNFQNKGNRCPFCYGNKKHTYDFVKKYIESIQGYKLLSLEYKNTNSKLKIQCDKDHIYDVSFHTFSDGSRCPVCDGKQKHTYDFVKEYIEKEKYKLLSNQYINNKTKLKIQCLNNHIFQMRFNDFQQGQRCPICNLSSSKGEKEVINYVKEIYDGEIYNNVKSILKNPLNNRSLELDIYLPDINKAVEYNGDYWHSQPRKIELDKIKLSECKKLNIDLLIIKENDWKNSKDKCLNQINNFIRIK